MTTIALPANLRRARWAHPQGQSRGTFTPNGRPRLLKNSRLLTPNWRSTEPTWAARLFVGFNVGNTPTYEMDDLVKLVKRVRKAQNKAEDSTFVYQRGIYTHDDGTGTVTEDGAQVVILNLDGTPKRQFEKQMIELANVIVAEMQQETVIVEMQQAGIVREVIGVTTLDSEMDFDADEDT